MGRDRGPVAEDVEKNPLTGKKVLNLGCGHKKFIGGVNVDKEPSCNPDVLLDMNERNWPLNDESFDIIYAFHIFEHLIDWWPAFMECARILKVGGQLQIRTPDSSSDSALSYRDHHHVFDYRSFHGVQTQTGIPFRSGTNAWAHQIEGTIPLKMVSCVAIPFRRYAWMTKWCPWLIQFMGNHMRNFIWEQVFVFEKIKLDREVKNE
jgi:SAM-dependent methyltransferase